MRYFDCKKGMAVHMPVVMSGTLTGAWRHGTVVAMHNPYNPPDTVGVAWQDGPSFITQQLVTARSLLTDQEYDEQASKERLIKMSIKKEDCVIDMRVALAGSTAPFRKGKIASPANANLVIVEFDDGTLKKHDLKHLLLLADAIVEENRITVAEKLRLEKEFQAEKQVADKVRQASDLIDEAAKLARSIGKDLMDMDSACAIEGSMERAGWNTSSWHC